jgi:seryl-tRNA synthetase
MLELQVIRNQKERVVNALKKRNLSEETLALVDEVIKLDEERRHIQTQLDKILSDINNASREVGMLMKSGQKVEAEAKKQEVAEWKNTSAELQSRFKDVKTNLEDMLYKLPNTPHESVDFGTSAEDNFLYKEGNIQIPQLEDDALPHWDIADKLGLFSLKDGVTLTGSGFPVYKGKGARLQRALINYFLDEAIQAGYEEIIPPLLVNQESARGTGQLPDKDGQMYYAPLDNLYLIPTAEVPVTNLYREAIIPSEKLPIKMVAYTPCFRREAGSYGADVKGLNRVHQFDKVEIVQIEHPDRSYETLHKMLDHVENLLIKLQLPYRILRLCGADTGFSSAMTYDFEVFSAAQKKWLEVSSVSCFESFQSNRMMMRFREENAKPQLVHTLNGSALALARIVAAILENNQSGGFVNIPEVLRPYTGFDVIN